MLKRNSDKLSEFDKIIMEQMKKRFEEPHYCRFCGKPIQFFNKEQWERETTAKYHVDCYNNYMYEQAMKAQEEAQKRAALQQEALRRGK